MDDQVVAAMARWPDVPAVFGWLSLNRQGQWRLHPQGDAAAGGLQTHSNHCADGEAITNQQILQFINRNYCSDARGRWYFQNGPQRVFVRLDAAPYILCTTGTNTELLTHTGLAVRHISSWWLDDEGMLYANTEHGAGLIAGRDAMAVFEALRTSDGQAVLELLESGPGENPVVIASLTADDELNTAVLHFCPSAKIPSQMGFIRCPVPDAP